VIGEEQCLVATTSTTTIQHAVTFISNHVSYNNLIKVTDIVIIIITQSTGAEHLSEILHKPILEMLIKGCRFMGHISSNCTMIK
jgi:hypothetical protein